MRTNHIGFLLERFAAARDTPAMAWRERSETYGRLSEHIARQATMLGERRIEAGTRVVLEGDYSPTTVALFLALIERSAVTAPLLPLTLGKAPELLDIVDADVVIRVGGDEEVTVSRRQAGTAHELIARLRQDGKPGLILFTSGSTGKPKGVVHDFTRLLPKFEKLRPSMRTLNFLLFDHWGGLNTLLQCLSNGSFVVFPEQRTPDHVCELIERHRIELLPASPTFLNMLLLSRAFEGRDLGSLRLITYGAEPMPMTTLKGLRSALPDVELRQTYGLIELGVLRAKSRSSDSLWVKVGGEGYDLRVVDGILQIKADSAMLGYLNAPSPVTEDGYLVTGDHVEVDGDYFRFLGRASELINVGGQKVYPVEVEEVLLQCREVADAVVYGEPNPITGSIVCATVKLRQPMDPQQARIAIKKFCGERVDAYKVPVKLSFASEDLYGDRLKRQRNVP